MTVTADNQTIASAFLIADSKNIKVSSDVQVQATTCCVAFGKFALSWRFRLQEAY